MDSRDLFNELAELFATNGYTVTQKDENIVEGFHANGVEFSMLIEDEYLEPIIHMFSDDLGVIYDIFEGEYNTDIFNDNAKTRKTAAEWEKILKDEVARLNLEKYLEESM